MRQRSSHIVTVAVILTVALALFFQGWMLVQGRRRFLELIHVRAANRAQATANQVQGLLRQTDLLLLDLRDHVDPAETARGPSQATAKKAVGMRDLMRLHMAQMPEVLAVNVVDPAGRFVYSTFDTVPEVTVGDREYFRAQAAADSDRMRVSEPLFGRVSRQWGLYVTRRLRTPQGQFAGILFAVLNSDRLGASLMAVDQRQWVLALYDQEARLVARMPAPEPGSGEHIGQASPEPLLHRWRQEAQVTFQGSRLGETSPHLWAIQPVDDLPLFTVAGFSEERALAQWNQDLSLNLTVGALLVAGCACILVLYQRHLRTQERLRESEAYFRALFDASPEAIAVIQVERGGQASLVDANAQYQELFCLVPGALRLPWELAPAAQPDGTSSLDKGARLCERSRWGQIQRSSWLFAREDGSRFDAELTLFALRHQARDLMIAVIRDLTEIRAMEEKLHQAQKLDALGQLAGGVAHDFNNMISAILASAELMTFTVEGEKPRKLARTIISAAERAGQLTQKLLAFARRGKLLSTPTDVHQVVQETVVLLQRTIDPRIRIVTRLEAEHAMVTGDPSQLQNALLNLGLNARDAMGGGGTLTLSSRTEVLEDITHRMGAFLLEPGEYLHLCIEDTGCGIPAHLLPKIFDPFYTTKDVGKGTGLGLASVFGAMASHKGAVTVESEEGRGSRFHLYLPLASRAVVPVPERLEAPVTGRGTLLLVDDEDFVRTATTMQLEALGYRVESQGEPREALAFFRERHRELSGALIDLVMPGLTGSEVALEMQRIAPGVPIVLMSGFPRNAQVTELLEQGVSGFIQKPFSRAELAGLLARVFPSG